MVMNSDSKFTKELSKSLNPLNAVRSSASVLGCRYVEDQIDIADVILAATTKFECPIGVDVCRPLDCTHKKPARKFKTGREFTPMVATVDSESEISPSSTLGRSDTTDNSGRVLILTAVHNCKNRLVEISMNKYRYTQIPRVLMQVLGIILPSYTKLTKFTIKDCFIDKFTIPELKNILSLTNITDVCLDASFLPEGNYDVLLHQSTSLQNLSLMRCNINDEVCKQIISKLHFQQPAENILLTLNLSSNQITDEGAKFIGQALRSNRHLRYLNLADNLITDDGFKYIFDALKEFPLTNDELLHTREQYMKHLRHSQIIYSKTSIDFDNKSINKSRKSSRRKTPSISSCSLIKSNKSMGSLKREKQMSSFQENYAKMKTEFIASNVVLFEHPFDKTQLIMKDGHSYSKGNMTLSYLNMAYNDLMYSSVQKLLEVLEYQKIHRNNNTCGLIKVVLNGNNLPVNCSELDSVDDLFKEIT